MGYSGARGKLIHEKNLMSKILCHTLFNAVYKAIMHKKSHGIKKLNMKHKAFVNFNHLQFSLSQTKYFPFVCKASTCLFSYSDIFSYVLHKGCKT
jgi:hypothetical protein